MVLFSFCFFFFRMYIYKHEDVATTQAEEAACKDPDDFLTTCNLLPPDKKKSLQNLFSDGKDATVSMSSRSLPSSIMKVGLNHILQPPSRPAVPCWMSCWCASRKGSAAGEDQIRLYEMIDMNDWQAHSSGRDHGSNDKAEDRCPKTQYVLPAWSRSVPIQA